MINKDEAITCEVAAASIRDRRSAYPSAGLSPRRLTNILRAADAGDLVLQMELFSEMEEKDAHLFSCLQTRKLAVSGSDWDILPGAPGGEEAASFAKDVVSGIWNFEEALTDLLDAVGKGFSVTEIMWDIEAGKIIPRELRKRPQKRFTFMGPDGCSGPPRLLTDDEPEFGVPLLPDKFMVHLYRAGADIPERGGLLRVLSWVYLFKNYALKDWVAFCEVFGMPLRLGVYAPSASKEDKEALVEAVTQLGSDAAGIISENTRIQFIEAAKGGTGSSPYGEMIDLMNKEVSKAVLGQTLTTDVGSSGSYAAGKVHEGVRMDIVRADARALERTVNRDLIRPLTELNFGQGVKKPVFKFNLQNSAGLQ
ncbi:MAG: DUF935 family protein [Nitrospirota bacterium]